MRIACPHCGERGNEEFAYLGAADPVRPAGDGSAAAWHGYAYLRENPAGTLREFWHHVHGCRRWLIVTRDTRTHEIEGVVDVRACGEKHGEAADTCRRSEAGAVRVTRQERQRDE
jgi:sarcosine oxidase subunit delta